MDEDSFTLVIFGVTGHLAQIKVIPALYDLVAGGFMPEKFSIIGLGRTVMDSEGFKKYFTDTLNTPNRHHVHPIASEVLEKLLNSLSYISGDFSDANFYDQLKKSLDDSPNGRNRIYYLATFPDLQETIFQRLQEKGLNEKNKGWLRVVIEKPIGTDLASAQKINALLSKYYVEDQIFRLDHYLGRETLQNLLTFRFGNNVFEPLINKEYIDQIQVTASEDFGVGERGGYYDTVGALKDVGQNHLIQMLVLSTMSAPLDFTNPSITKRRIELIESLTPEPDKVVFGQYKGYTNEKNVKPDSKTDTYFALRAHINSDRFAGVPIYMRAGKGLARTVTEVSIVFKNISSRLFSQSFGGLEPNMLVYRIQPNEGIVLRILTKTPGTEMKLEETYMQFCYKHLKTTIPDPYHRLIVDILNGNQMFFNDAPEVEAQWRFTDPLSAVRKEPFSYDVGSWGPKEANDLIAADGRAWIEPSIAFCNL